MPVSPARRRSRSAAASSRESSCSIRPAPRFAARWRRAGVSRGALSIARIDASGEMRGGVGKVTARVAGTRGRDFSLRHRRGDRARALPAQRPRHRRPPLDPAHRAGPAHARGRRMAARSDRADLRRRQCQPVRPVRRKPNRGQCADERDAALRARHRLADSSASAESPRARSPTVSRKCGDPSGSANLRVRGLTRSGLVLSSKPVDIGLVARLEGRNAGLRAIAVSEGKTIGRVQARLAPIGTSGDIGTNGSPPRRWRRSFAITARPIRCGD